MSGARLVVTGSSLGRWLGARSIPRVAGWSGLVLVVGFLVASPIVRLQVLAIEDGAAAYSRLLDHPRLSGILVTTFGLAIGSVAIAIVLGTMLAWYAYQLKSRQRWLAVIPILPLVVPVVASIIGWAFLLSPRVGYLNRMLRSVPWWSHLDSGPLDVYSGGMIVMLTAINLTAFVYLFVITALRNLNAELYEAADSCGASGARRFFTVTLPLLRPSIVHASILVLLLGLGQFAAPLLLGRQNGFDVITTEMFRLTQQFPLDVGLGAAFSSPLIVMGIVLFFVQRWAIGDTSRFVSQTGKQVRSIGGSRFASIPILLFALVALVLPLLALIHVSLLPFWSGTLTFRGLTLDNLRRIIDSPLTRDAVVTSVTTSLLAIAICLPITFTAALLLRQGSAGRHRKQVLEMLLMLPLLIPAVIFGFGILFTYSNPPFELYGTMIVVVVTYVTLMLPHGTRLLSSGVLTLGEQYFEASDVSGAGPLQKAARVTVPLMRPSLGAATALMFVLLSHEFSASLFVRSRSTNLMGAVLYDLWAQGSYPLVASLALVMCLVTAVGVSLAFLVGGARAFDEI